MTSFEQARPLTSAILEATETPPPREAFHITGEVMTAPANPFADSSEFACPQCDRRFLWEPDFAGRPLACPCGATIIAIEGDPLATLVQAAPAAPEPVPPAPRTPVHRDAAGTGASATAVHAAHASHTAHAPAGGGRGVTTVASGYVVPHRARPQALEDDDRSPARDWVVPLALLVVGLAGRAAEVLFMRPTNTSVPAAAVFAVAGIVLGVVALFAGVLAAAQFMGAELDPLHVLARKLVALAAFAAAAAVVSASVDKEPGQIRGLLVALHVLLLLYFMGLSYLLKLDLLEALVATVITLAVQVGLSLAIAQALPAAAARALFYGS